MHVPTDYKDPNFANKSKVHDWLNYINDNLAAMWDTFSDAQKAAIAANADEIASNEEWD